MKVVLEAKILDCAFTFECSGELYEGCFAGKIAPVDMQVSLDFVGEQGTCTMMAGERLPRIHAKWNQ
jgi:hypothetical protein